MGFSNRYPSSENRSQSCLGRRHRLDVEDGAQQVADDLVLALLSRLLDFLDLLLGLLVGLLLGLLVSLRVLVVRRAASVTCVGERQRGRGNESWCNRPPTHLSLELLVLFLLLGLVCLYLLLGLVASLLDALCPVWFRAVSQSVGQSHGAKRVGAVAMYSIGCVHSLAVLLGRYRQSLSCPCDLGATKIGSRLDAPFWTILDASFSA